MSSSNRQENRTSSQYILNYQVLAEEAQKLYTNAMLNFEDVDLWQQAADGFKKIFDHMNEARCLFRLATITNQLNVWRQTAEAFSQTPDITSTIFCFRKLLEFSNQILDIKNAADHINKYAELTNNFMAWREAASLYNRIENYRSVAYCYEQASRCSENLEKYTDRREAGKAFMVCKDYKSAARHFDSTAEITKLPADWQLAGDAYSKNAVKNAAFCYNKKAEITKTAEDWQQAGYAYVKVENWANAFYCYNRKAEKTDTTEDWEQAANTAFVAHKYFEAGFRYGKIAEKMEKNKLIENEIIFRRKSGEAYFSSGNDCSSDKSFESFQCAAFQFGIVAKLTKKFEDYRQAGDVYFKINDFNNAAFHYNHINKETNDIHDWLGAAESHLALKDYMSAAHCFYQVTKISKQPEHFRLAAGAYHHMATQESDKKAAQCYEQAARNGGHANDWENAAKSHYLSCDYLSSAHCYQKSAEALKNTNKEIECATLYRSAGKAFEKANQHQSSGYCYEQAYTYSKDQNDNILAKTARAQAHAPARESRHISINNHAVTFSHPEKSRRELKRLDTRKPLDTRHTRDLSRSPHHQ